MRVTSQLCSLLLAIAATAAGGASPAPESRTGCLNLRSGGQYILTEEKAAKAVTVVAVDPQVDLKSHSHNHRVTVTGVLTTEQGAEVFKASAIHHLGPYLLMMPSLHNVIQ